MCSLFVDRIGETFTDDAPLKCEITVIIECGTFVRTPTHGAVVYDNVLVRFSTIHCVVAFLFDVDSHTVTVFPDYWEEEYGLNPKKSADGKETTIDKKWKVH